MASVVVDANAVGNVLIYVAPGFLSYLGYRTRYPAPHRPAGEVLIVSVVASLPLVALVGALLPGRQQANQLGYVLMLLALGLALGYGGALLRGTSRARRLLEQLGYRIQPEGTVYAQTLQHMSPDATVLVELTDGQRFSGCPRIGSQHKDDGVNELYLVYAKAQSDDGSWLPVGGPGIIVPLSQLRYVVLSEEPTGAPAEPAADRPAHSGTNAATALADVSA